ncbi:MAG TPA: TolC family protein [Blastocatellia bacterium]|nr:TolC family protein [Blastocatellia bacterium]
MSKKNHWTSLLSFSERWRGAQAPIRALSILIIVSAITAAGYGQEPATASDLISGKVSNHSVTEVRTAARPGTTENGLAEYVDSVQGSSSVDLVRRALSSNAELAAARLEIDRGRARLRQAGLRPNPTLDFEQTSGIFNTQGERETSVGFSLPLELAGQRGRRIDLARAELEAAEAEIADRERRLAAEIRAVFAEALAAARELEVTQNLNTVDVETVRIVEARVLEGDAAPLELNLMRAEADRLRARRALIEGRLQASLLRLKQLAGIPMDEGLRLREALTAPVRSAPPATPEAAVEIAMRTRPDLRLARLTEEVAKAGYQLARAQAAPQVAAFTRYTDGRSSFDQTPVGVLRDRDKLLSFGVSITLPVLNRNQGSQAEAQLAIAQAQRRREFAESSVRSEIMAAYRRYEASRVSLQTYEQGVIARSAQNVRTMRAAYEAGAFRMSELLAEQRRLIDSQRELTETLAERYRAMADLETALGVTIKE